MKTARIILSCMLVLAVLSTGMPQKNVADFNGDGATDLADAILGLQKFEKTSENPRTFSVAVSDMITTLQVVAGFKKVIKADQTQGNQSGNNSIPCYGPMTVVEFNLSHIKSPCETERGYLYQSIRITPPTPPPVSRSLC